MKVLGIVCSPRVGGNSEILVRQALEGAKSMSAETDLWTTAKKTNLQPCDACLTCFESKKCHIKDDIQELYPKIEEADGLIFGSPTYFRTLSAQAKIVIDRLYVQYVASKLVGKVAGVISVSQAIGNESTLDIFHKFISLCHMFAADDVWAFGVPRGDVKKYEYAMKASEEMGKQVVALIKKRYEYPEEYRPYIYGVVQNKYGLETTPTIPSGRREE